MNSELRSWIIKLGEAIRRLRLKKRIRAKDISEGIGRPMVRYIEMENGQRGAYNYLPEIARYLKVPLNYFDKYWPPRGRVQNWLHMFVYRPEAKTYLTEHIKKLPLKKR